MRKIFTLLILCFLFNSYSQSPLLWSEDYPVGLTSHTPVPNSLNPHIISEKEDSFKVIGRKNISSGQRLSIVEYDLDGNVVSEQDFGGDLVFNNTIIDYKFDDSNHIYIVNHERININKSNIVFQKYSLDGNSIWAEQLQDSGLHSYEPLFLSVSENGTIFLSAQKYIFDFDVFYDFSNRLYAYDSDGNQLWERTFDQYTELDIIFADYVYNNEIYLFGMDSSTFQVFKIVKVDVDNNMVLNVFTDLQNGINQVHLTEDNNLLITAVAKYRISKIDLNGNLLWSEYFQENPPINPYLQETRSSIQDENGNIYVTGRYWQKDDGTTNNDILTLKFDSSGNLLWQNLYQYGGNNADIGNAIFLKNGNIYVGGQSQRLGITTDYDYVLLKIDAETGVSNGLYRYNGIAEGTDVIKSLYVFDDDKVALTGLSYNGNNYDWTTQLLSDVPLSVENISEENNIKIYPNPIEEDKLLHISGKKMKDYSIFSLTGQVLKEGEFDSEEVHIITVENLPQGVYLIQLNTDIGTETRKIIIR